MYDSHVFGPLGALLRTCDDKPHFSTSRWLGEYSSPAQKYSDYINTNIISLNRVLPLATNQPTPQRTTRAIQMPEWIKSHADEDEWTINPAYTRLKRDLNQLSKDIITFVNAQGGWITNADAQTRLANALATNINQISVTLHSTSGYGEMV